MSEVKRLKAIIAEQKKEIFQLKSVLDTLPGSVYWKDRDGVYLGRNLYAAEKRDLSTKLCLSD